MAYKKPHYVAVIPARIGSKRVQKKNTRLLDGKPMVQYAIEACKKSSKVKQIFVNTDSELIGQIAINNEVEYYKRESSLATDTVKQEEFIYDFMKNTKCQFVVLVNPVNPLTEASDIDSAIDYFESSNIDTLISVKEERLHAFYEDKPLNFERHKLFQATQDIEPVLICSWNICIWKKSVFMKSYEENGFATFSGVVGKWVVNPIKAVKISYEEDFILAEHIIKSKRMN